MAEVYDIFISYRRDGGFETAKLLNGLLVQDGYSVSFDIDTLREGDFDQALLKRIEQCRDFLLIIDNQAFDRMINPASDYNPAKDWLRVEITYALQLKKNIVPVLLAGASFPAKMPEDLDGLETKNGPQYSKEYFDSFYNKLKGFLYSVPRSQPLVPHSLIPDSSRPKLKIKADLDCVFYLDGEKQMTLTSGKIVKFPLDEGEYELEFVSLENATDRQEETFEMKNGDRFIHVKLAEIRAARLEKENTKQQEQEELLRQVREKADQEAKKDAFPKDQTFIVNGVSFVMKPIEGGTFKMGSDIKGSKNDEKPVHSVTVDSFFIGETTVTQALWKAVMDSEPTFNGGWEKLYGKGDDYPAYYISWEDCNEFIRKLKLLLGKDFRLPTEAEWEFAARGGNLSKGYIYAGSNDFDDVAVCRENSYAKGSKSIDYGTHKVKSKKPNELGIYDMSGNVWEWCQDWYARFGNVVQTNPIGPLNGTQRVLRGGCWAAIADSCRVSTRHSQKPVVGTHIYVDGFRLALSL